MKLCERKGVMCECLTDHSNCNSDNCHRKLPDIEFTLELEGSEVMELTLTEKANKELYFARRVLDSLNMVSEPRLVYEEEKKVVEKALRKYISELEYKEYSDR